MHLLYYTKITIGITKFRTANEVIQDHRKPRGFIIWGSY